MQKQIISINEFLNLLGFKSRTTYYNLEKLDPTFPKRIRLGARKVGLYLDDVNNWIKQKPYIT